MISHYMVVVISEKDINGLLIIGSLLLNMNLGIKTVCMLVSVDLKQ